MNYWIVVSFGRLGALAALFQHTRVRRTEIGTHHHVSGQYLSTYANEMAWREDNRRKPNGTLDLLAASAALAHPVSRQSKGYWQRSVA